MVNFSLKFYDKYFMENVVYNFLILLLKKQILTHKRKYQMSKKKVEVFQNYLMSRKLHSIIII